MSYDWNKMKQIFSEYLIDNFKNELLSDDVNTIIKTMADTNKGLLNIMGLFPGLKSSTESTLLFIVEYFRELGYEINLLPFCYNSGGYGETGLYLDVFQSISDDWYNSILPKGAELKKSNLQGIQFIDCEGNTLIKSIELPESITYIYASAFGGCERLEKVVIPSTVNSIHTDVFYDCVCLEELNYMGTMKQWESIEKKPNWKTDSLLTRIVCTDGVINLQ